MNVARRPLSPESPSHRPWSGASSPRSPIDTKTPRPFPSRDPAPGAAGASFGPRNLPTPPESAGSNGMNGYMNGSGPPPSAMNGYMNGGGGRMGGPYGGSAGAPSPPASVSRMSNGTQMSSSEAQMRKQSMMEENLNQHYIVLKRYLGNVLNEDPTAQKPNRARDKLVRLSGVQFQELSTDVYDELRRRQAVERGANAPNALPPRDNFHPKRNQARQKLSTLASERFGALATDVLFELDRRFPRFGGGGNIDRMGSPRLPPPQRNGSPGPGLMPPNRPKDTNRRIDGSFGGSDRMRPAGMQPKQSQSNTAVPNKSYLVEEDDGDMDSVYNKRDTMTTSKSHAVSDKVVEEYKTQIDDLNRKMERLESQLDDKERYAQDKADELKARDRQLQERDDEIERLEERNRSSARNNDEAEQEWGGLRKNLEGKVADAEALNQNLQAELDRIQAENQEREADLRNQMDTIARKKEDGGEWRARFNEMQQETTGLKRENQDLQEQLRKQQTSTQGVRRELEGFLTEMKTIVDRSEGSLQREEQLRQQVRSLEADLRAWKNRCAQMKTQLGPSDSISLQQPDVLREAFVRPDGLIQYTHVTSFQLAVDELLRAARARDTAMLLETLRTVVVAIKDICDDVPGSSSSSSSSAPAAATQQRTKVSAMANNLITATKNFAAAKGLSPVSLVDAAAANVATAVVDLAHLVKMQPSPDRADLDLDGVPEEVIDEEPELHLPEPDHRRGGAYLSITSRGSMSESVYSSTTAAARASTRLQTLPNSTYNASSSQQPPPSIRRPSPSSGSSPVRDPNGTSGAAAGNANGFMGLRKPSFGTQANGANAHRQQPSYASQTSQSSSQGGLGGGIGGIGGIGGGGHRPSFTRNYSGDNNNNNNNNYGGGGGGGDSNSGGAQHRPQPSYASQSSYNSQQSTAAPAPLGGGGGGGGGSSGTAGASRPTGGLAGNSAFNDRFNAISPGPSNLTGPGSGPGPLSPIPATPSNGGSRFGGGSGSAVPSPGLGAPSGMAGSNNSNNNNNNGSLSVPSAGGGGNGGGGGGGGSGSGPDAAAVELSVTLDEESAQMIDSIQALVTAIRTNQAPAAVRTKAGTVARTLERILGAAQGALAASPALKASPVARIAENLAMAQRRLGVADENAGSCIERGEEKGDAWREVVRVFPPVAFEVAREVRELGAKVKELGRGGAGDESEDDFR